MWLWIFFYSIIFLRIYISIISPIQKDNANILKFPSERHIIENSKDTKLVEKTSESIKLEFLFFLESFLKIPQYPSGKTLL